MRPPPAASLRAAMRSGESRAERCGPLPCAAVRCAADRCAARRCDLRIVTHSAELSTGSLLDLGTSRHPNATWSTNQPSTLGAVHRCASRHESALGGACRPNLLDHPLRAGNSHPNEGAQRVWAGNPHHFARLPEAPLPASTDLLHSLWITIPTRNPLWTTSSDTPQLPRHPGPLRQDGPHLLTCSGELTAVIDARSGRTLVIPLQEYQFRQFGQSDTRDDIGSSARTAQR